MPPAKKVPFHRTVQGRRWLRGLGIVLGAFAAGWLLTVFVLYPAPLFRKDQRVALVYGLPRAEAQRRITEQGFRVRTAGEEPHPSIPAGSVIWQDPAAGTILPPGSSVRLTMSTGPATNAVPDVVGLDVRQAQRVLSAGGFRVGTIDSVSASAEPGTVIGTRPSEGVGRPPGTPVDLIVSRGRSTQPGTMP
ncbi:MAG: PASTA domain-containing protein [Gemmatimonadota bacterium]